MSTNFRPRVYKRDGRDRETARHAAKVDYRCIRAQHGVLLSVFLCRYNNEIPFFEMLVPTVDTVRYGYLMEKLLSVGHSVLFTGITGVGKVCVRNRLQMK